MDIARITTESINWALRSDVTSERCHNTPESLGIHPRTYTQKYTRKAQYSSCIMATRDQEQTEIIHININGITNKHTELIHYLNEHNPQFVTINESKIRKQHTIRIPNYHVIRKDRENQGRGVGGGVAILIRKDKNLMKNSLQYHSNLIKKRLHWLRYTTLLELNLVLKTLNSYSIRKCLLSRPLNKYPDSIFMGDYNSKHDFFGCKKYNKEGDILFNILEELNLIVTNDGTPTHYTNTSSNILDLCIVSRSIAMA